MLLAFDRPIWNGDAMLIPKASVRLALNPPHTRSSHLDVLTCTLHNAWAAWIYITPCTAHSHTHTSTCTTMHEHTGVCTMTGAYTHEIAMHTNCTCWHIYVHTNAVHHSCTQNDLKTQTPWWESDTIHVEKKEIQQRKKNGVFGLRKKRREKQNFAVI